MGEDSENPGYCCFRILPILRIFPILHRTIALSREDFHDPRNGRVGKLDRDRGERGVQWRRIKPADGRGQSIAERCWDGAFLRQQRIFDLSLSFRALDPRDRLAGGRAQLGRQRGHNLP